MYLDTKETEEIVQAAMGLAPGPREAVLILMAEAARVDAAELVARLADRGVGFLGGIFPGVTHGERSYETGVVLAKLPVVEPPLLLRDLATPGPELDRLTTAADPAGRRATALILADGLSPDIEAFLGALYDRLGTTVNYLGGGAGSLSLRPQRCVFTADGFVENGAALALVDLDSGIGVRHGWRRLAGPIVATATDHNRVDDLNWRSAFEVYAETVEADSGRSLRPDNFFEIAKGYPFGIFKEGHEDVVRDPISVTGSGAVVCVGEVPPNTVLHIMKGDRQALIAAAAQAAEESIAAAPDRIATGLVIDCISRVIFLEKEFGSELGAAAGKIRRVMPDQALIGMLTLGEIASGGDGYLEFLNKTMVVGLLGD